MKKLSLVLITLFLIGCKVQDNTNQSLKLIVYKLPFKVEILLLKQIELNPKPNYCILIDEKENKQQFILVDSYSYYHKHTSYRALIGKKYYPISFPEFDRRYGVITQADEFLKMRIENKNPKTPFGKQSYPMYHGFYKIEIDMKGNIIFKGFVY